MANAYATSSLGHVFPGFSHSAARTQALDAISVKPQLLEDLIGVLAEPGRAPCRHLGDTMHLDWAADRRGELAAGAFERNDDVVRLDLRVVDDFLRLAHGPDRKAAEHLVPMRHWLSAEDLVENGDKFVPDRCELRGIGESWICQEARKPDGFRRIRPLVGCDGDNKPRDGGGAVHIPGGARGIAAIMHPVELRVGQRGLDRNACRPDALSQERGRDIRALARALTAIECGNDRRIDADACRGVAAAGYRPGWRRPGIPAHRQT